MIRVHVYLAAVASAVWCVAASAQLLDVRPELWDRPRTAAALLADESLKRVALAAIAQPDAQVVIHHVPGQDAEVQAEELKSWLGALAIDPKRVVLRNDLAAGAFMKVEIVP